MKDTKAGLYELMREERRGQEDLEVARVLSPMLDCGLACYIRDKKPLARALAYGYLAVEDGCLVWKLENKTLLAYFLGRLICGDKPVYIKRKGTCIWKQGNIDFPFLIVKLVFGLTTLKRLRRQRENRTVPENSQLIDNLFS